MGDSTRFYTSNGDPAYEAGLREARAEGHGVSVTTITHQWQNFGLEKYKQSQAILASLTLTRRENETDDDYIDRVVEDADAHRDAAASMGTIAHGILANCINRTTIEWDHVHPNIKESLRQVVEWIHDAQILGKPETSFWHPYGFGGTRDLEGTMWSKELASHTKVLIDWKTQFVRGQNKDGTLRAQYHPEWAWQLAAYRLDTDIPLENCFSVVISTNPDLPGYRVKQWPAYHKTQTCIAQSTAVFLSLLQTWQIINKFPCPILAQQLSPLLTYTNDIPA